MSAKLTSEYLVYADGACIGNPGPGGWGVVVRDPDGSERELSGSQPGTTNQRMEITAAIEGLRAVPPGANVTLRSDSQYVVRTMNDNWQRKANVDLWPDLDAERVKRRVRFEWVRGHATDQMNARADRLANDAARGIKRPPSEEDQARELQPVLTSVERIAKCSGCGKMFVARDARVRYCDHVECQIKARRPGDS